MRAARRAVALVLTLAACVVRYWFGRLRGPYTLERRALWLQGCARLLMRSMGIQAIIQGQPPTHGLVVANHLSYLDVVILSAAMPCFFVAKMEIDAWPFFGKAARSGGTIFLDRASRASANSVASQMTQRLQMPIPVLLFPEGTSTEGAQVLRFHSRLIHPATVAGAPITAAAIRYVMEDGTPERELCWFGNALFLPHLWKTLGTAGFSAEIRFGQPHIYLDRRIAAESTHSEIEAMRADVALVLD
ncbi:MAG: lysophospholipid acyltransferase family protein [Terracidiphilus sp.]